MILLSEAEHILFDPGERDTDNAEEFRMLKRAEDEAKSNRQTLSQIISDIQSRLFTHYGLLIRDNRFDMESRGLVLFLRNGQERSYEVEFPEEIPRKMLSVTADLVEGYRVKVQFDTAFGKPKIQEAMGVITRTLKQLGYTKSEAEEMYNAIQVTKG